MMVKLIAVFRKECAAWLLVRKECTVWLLGFFGRAGFCFCCGFKKNGLNEPFGLAVVRLVVTNLNH